MEVIRTALPRWQAVSLTLPFLLAPKHSVLSQQHLQDCLPVANVISACYHSEASWRPGDSHVLELASADSGETVIQYVGILLQASSTQPLLKIKLCNFTIKSLKIRAIDI